MDIEDDGDNGDGPHCPLCPRFRLARILLVSRKRGHWGRSGDGRDKYCFYKLTLFLN